MVHGIRRDFTIVLVDDDNDEAEFLLEAIKESGLPVRLVYYKDYYQLLSSISTSELPDLLVMDINLPLKNGIEALQELKQNHVLSTIPAVTFTSTSSERYFVESKKAGALQLCIKPSTITGYKEVLNYFYNICSSNQSEPPASLSIAS